MILPPSSRMAVGSFSHPSISGYREVHPLPLRQLDKQGYYWATPITLDSRSHRVESPATKNPTPRRPRPPDLTWHVCDSISDFQFELTWHVSDFCFRFQFAIPISRFRDSDFGFRDFSDGMGGPGLRPYTVRPAEHGN